MKKIFYISILVCMFSFLFIHTKTSAKNIVVSKGNQTILYSKWTYGRKMTSLGEYHIKSIKSSNPKIAKVNRYGVVTAKKAGKAKITLIGYKDLNHKYVKKRTWTIVVKKKIAAKNQYEYKTENFNGTKGITLRKYIGNDSNITIPRKIGGIPVVKIDRECFGINLSESVKKGSYVEKSITMGDNIKYIGDYAFSCCTNLKSVKLSEKLENVGSGIFAYSAVNKLNIDAIYGLGYVPDWTFTATPVISNKYTNLKIPANVKSIGVRAFADTKIAGITLEEGLEEIKAGAFSNVEMYDTKDDTYQWVKIPSTVKEIGNQSFYCKTLTRVTINNPEIKIAEDAFLMKIKANHTAQGSVRLEPIEYEIPLVISGFSGSTAETWAGKNNVSFVEL